MIAAVFPGQGSQKPGMGRNLVENHDAARKVFDEVSAATGIDTRRLCCENDEDALRQTQNAQLALFTCGLAAWACLNEALPGSVAAVAGHSVGEYDAVVAAGVYRPDDGARLVQIRGELMAQAGSTAPGAMAAVIGLDRDQLQQALEAAGGLVVIANDNCPGQLVISGEPSAVTRAGELAVQAGARRVMPLNVSGAFHSPLMEKPAEQMGEALAAYEACSPTLRIYANVTSEPVENAVDWPSLLERQLKSPVRWTETVRHMILDGVDCFVECGPGEVLSGLIRRIDKSVKTFAVSDNASLNAAVKALAKA